MAIVKAPWNLDQVECLSRWQADDCVHPFTCGGPNRENHRDPERRLLATTEGWVCLDCTYTQNWAHDFMLTWKGPNAKEQGS
jgi:hypothetical protein